MGHDEISPRSSIVFWSAFGVFSQLAFVRVFSTTAGETTYYGNIFFLVAIFAMSCGFFCRSLSALYYWIPLGILANYLFVMWLGNHNLLQQLPAEFQWTTFANLAPKEANFDLQLAVLLLCTTLTPVMILIGSSQGTAFIESGYKTKGYLLMAIGGIAGAMIFTLQNRFFSSQWILLLLWMLPFVAFISDEYKSKQSRFRTYLLLIPIVVLIITGWTFSRLYYWSPYQRVGVEFNRKSESLYVYSNDFFISAIQLRSAAELNQDPKWLVQAAAFQSVQPGDRALIMGSGGGTQDVREALFHGASSVVAVEIDPVFVTLGKKYDSERTYFKPSVRTKIDDARHFLNTSHEKFDFIYLPFLDSQTNASNQSRFRLDSFLYTEEGLRFAYDKLNNNGIFFVSFAAGTSWIRQRMFNLLQGATGAQIRVFMIPNAAQTTYVVSRGRPFRGFPPPYVELTDHFTHRSREVVPTDDWPFLYSRSFTIPLEHQRLIYVVCIGMFCILLLTRNLSIRSSPCDSLSERAFVNYAFFSGAAFFFIQINAISALTTWFGASYISQAMVVMGIIVSSLLGALLAFRFPLVKVNVAWVFLFATLIVGYHASDQFHPLHGSILPSAGIFLAAMLLPILFAGYVYLRYLENLSSHQILRMQLWNLVGGAIGGLAEGIVVILGFRSSLWIAFGFYTLGFLCAQAGQILRSPESVIEKPSSVGTVHVGE